VVYNDTQPVAHIDLFSHIGEVEVLSMRLIVRLLTCYDIRWLKLYSPYRLMYVFIYRVLQAFVI